MLLKCVKAEKRKRKFLGAPPEKWPYVGSPYYTQSFDCYVEDHYSGMFFLVPMTQRRYELLASVARHGDWEWVWCLGFNIRFCHTSAVPVTSNMLIWVDETDGPRYPRRLAAFFDATHQDDIALPPQ